MRSVWRPVVSQFRRDVLAVHEHAEAAIALATEQGFTPVGGLEHEPAWVGAGHAGPGRGGDGPGTPGDRRLPSHRGSADHPILVHRTGGSLWPSGPLEEGLQALAEAHVLVEQHEERYWEAEVYRLRGVLLLRQPGTPQAEAEAWLQRALDVARRQQAKSLELRAAMSLARLWQQQGKRAEARALLAPIYGWFTEGFDTADLQDAKRCWRNSGANTRRPHPRLPPWTRPLSQRGATARDNQPQYEESSSTVRGVGGLRGAMDYGTQYPWHNRPTGMDNRSCIPTDDAENRVSSVSTPSTSCRLAQRIPPITLGAPAHELHTAWSG